MRFPLLILAACATGALAQPPKIVAPAPEGDPARSDRAAPPQAIEVAALVASPPAYDDTEAKGAVSAQGDPSDDPKRR